MVSVSKFMEKAKPCPTPAAQQAFWACDGQSLLAIHVAKLSNCEGWTFLPEDDSKMETFAHQIESYSRKWSKLSKADLEDLISVLAGLELGAVFYLLAWLEHQVENESAITRLISTSSLMASQANEPEKRHGQIFWDRISAVIKTLVPNDVVVDALKQRVLTDA